jgi:lipopolysaccharide transport system permease protein
VRRAFTRLASTELLDHMNPHQAHATSPRALFESLFAHRELVGQLVRRDVIGRYRGSLLGVAWSLFNPILMLLVYTFVFSFVFKTRWGGDVGDSHTSFAILLFVGMIVHALFSEVANRAPTLILTNVSYVKRVVFPLEILPWVALGSALFHGTVSLTVLLIAQLLINHTLPWTFILFPLVLLPFLTLIIGVAWFLAATGVYVRDIVQTIGIITMVMLFLSPVFYPLSTLPPRLQLAFYVNPLTFIIEESRKVLLLGQMPSWVGLVFYMVIGTAVAWTGFWWFQRTRNGFADVV